MMFRYKRKNLSSFHTCKLQILNSSKWYNGGGWMTTDSGAVFCNFSPRGSTLYMSTGTYCMEVWFFDRLLINGVSNSKTFEDLS